MISFPLLFSIASKATKMAITIVGRAKLYGEKYIKEAMNQHTKKIHIVGRAITNKQYWKILHFERAPKTIIFFGGGH